MRNFIFVFFIIIYNSSFCQDGTPDATFGNNGKFEFSISETSFATVSNIHHLADGSYLVLALSLIHI